MLKHRIYSDGRLHDASEWTWASPQGVALDPSDIGVALNVGAGEDGWSGLILRAPCLSDQAIGRFVIRSNASKLTIDIDPCQFHGVIDHMEVIGNFDWVAIASPIWPGDPTELGTAQIDTLHIRKTKQVALGGDELYIQNLVIDRIFSNDPRPEVERDDAWSECVILADSKVAIATEMRVLGLELEDRSHFQGPNRTPFFLGRVGTNAELLVPSGVGFLEDWKLHLCRGDERIHLKGIAPLDYGVVRRLERRISETSDKLIGTYEPAYADRVPLDLSKTSLARSDWVQAHARLVEQYCRDPKVRAEARWLKYEDRRVNSPALGPDWFVLSALRTLGYGLKVWPPFAAWLLCMIGIVVVYCLNAHMSFDPWSGWAGWRRAGLVWVDVVVLPVNFAWNGTSSMSSTFKATGTGLALSRIILLIPLAALLLALRSRFQIPRWNSSDSEKL